MKTFYSGFLIVILFMTMGCSKSSSPSVSLAGKWTVTDDKTTGCTNTASNYDSPCTSNCTTITFTSNTFSSSYTSNGTTYTSSGTYAISGNKITTTVTGQSSVVDTFTLSGNTLIVISATGSNGCISSTTLVKQ